MKIVEAEAAHIDAWAGMRHALWPHHPLQEHVGEIREYFSGRRDDVAACFLAFSDNCESIGFIEMGLRSHAAGCATGSVAYIEGLYVEPEFRRKGVASRLMESAEQWAIGHGHREIASDALLDNVISHQAHRKMGFDEVESVVLFRKSLA